MALSGHGDAFSVSSAFGGKAEILCSDRVFPLMTQSGRAHTEFQLVDMRFVGPMSKSIEYYTTAKIALKR